MALPGERPFHPLGLLFPAHAARMFLAVPQGSIFGRAESAGEDPHVPSSFQQDAF